ncbi:hypothetical protein [Acidovorax sp. NB1]|uniref:hypothetical protein n=1 Tax=Acidovorax sp. NB1 TaxID=1943571 RepID=UPI0010F0B9E7|nr:hypothetical protein [Acidovorax sp. NB1]GDY35460.1 hypothetical protein ACINB_13520 [Acidovorax sp. NB1]
MSQNTLTLQLFFEDPIKLKIGQLVYQYMCADNTEQAQRWANKLGAPSLEALWDMEWFNQSASAAPSHLVLQFDTGTSGDLPLLQIETLFRHGLQAAVLEVFYDQVGETERMHFDRGQWVSRQAFTDANPQWRAEVEPAHQDGESHDGEAENRYACSKDPAKPLAVAKLRQQEEKRKREAREAAEAFVEMARAMGKSGKSPVQGLMAVLLLRAGFKGLVHAVVFTVVTVLLFKGFWLWMGVGLVLAVALPLYYMATEHKELRGDDGDDGPATVMAAQ